MVHKILCFLCLLYPRFLPRPWLISGAPLSRIPKSRCTQSFQYLISSLQLQIHHRYTWVNVAPFVEKLTFVKYGRRKFWIVIGLLMTTIMTFPLVKNLTNQNEHIEVVFLIFMILLFVSMGDIAIDAASAKELNNPVLSSMLQLFFQNIGFIFGTLILLKLVGPTDWFFTKNKRICSA